METKKLLSPDPLLPLKKSVLVEEAYYSSNLRGLTEAELNHCLGFHLLTASGNAFIHLFFGLSK
ncbi:MAG: hypothetical protein QG657_4426, partial [Acidobacteriota bacterium]|nr:hypothetical protein [Acidobacteriota bacterium]